MKCRPPLERQIKDFQNISFPVSSSRSLPAKLPQALWGTLGWRESQDPHSWALPRVPGKLPKSPIQLPPKDGRHRGLPGHPGKASPQSSKPPDRPLPAHRRCGSRKSLPEKDTGEVRLHHGCQGHQTLTRQGAVGQGPANPDPSWAAPPWGAQRAGGSTLANLKEKALALLEQALRAEGSPASKRRGCCRSHSASGCPHLVSLLG